MQIEAETIDFDASEISVTRAMQILYELRRECIGAAIGKIDHNAACGLIVLRRRCSWFSFKHLPTTRLGRFKLRVTHIDHGCAPIPAGILHGVRPPPPSDGASRTA
jgi:hypothetical protein